MQPNGLYLDTHSEFISESRQAVAALINLDFNVPAFTVDEVYKQPLYFMNPHEWENPWKAGAHLSHYIFYMNQLNRKEEIIRVLKQLKQFEHRNGWYTGNPKPSYLINGIMKVFTAFDVIGYQVNTKMAINIIDYLLANKESRGGCGIYDYIYVVTKCLDAVPKYRYNECKTHLLKLAGDILDHQQKDGGFKYDNKTDRAQRYYGQDITPDGMIGSIHGTTLFSMALARLDKYFDIGMGLHLPIS
jgi:hypothetical protein